MTGFTGPIDACQACLGRHLTSVLFIGYLPPVNLCRKIGTPANEEISFPAELLYCTDCHLVQIGYAADPAILFPPEYPYTSGTTRILRENFAELHREAVQILGLAKSDLVIDIGSNDGTLLANFAGAGHRVVGIEPTRTAELALVRGIPTVNEFLGPAAVEQVLERFGRARLVTATNVFAHIPDIHSALGHVCALLAEDGVFVTESHYLLDLVETLQYDTIYHEHLRYYSLCSLQALLAQHGLVVVSVKRIPTHGGSIRIYAARRGSPAPSVRDLISRERQSGLLSTDWIEPFKRRVLRSKLDLYATLGRIVEVTGAPDGIGAPSRATTLIHYVGLDEVLLPRVLEVSSSKKIGMYVPGRRIPIEDEARLTRDAPRHVLLLSWHIAPELCRNLKKRGYGGDFIVPLPSPHVIRSEEISLD